MKKTHILRALRVVLACLMFAGVTLLLCDYTGPSFRYVKWIAELQFFTGVLGLVGCFSLGSLLVVALTLIVTLLFGRVYCSVVCPLGIMQDIMMRVKRRRHWRYERGPVPLRWTVFVVFLVLLVLWHPVASVLEPYSAYSRIVQMFCAPTRQPVFMLVLSVVLFVGISVWAVLKGRGWCNAVCPVGTFLGLLSKHSLMRPTIDPERCTQCGACERNCKAQCIDLKTHSVDMSRCVDCFDCLDKCRFGAMTFSTVKGHKSKDEGEMNPQRRKFLGVLGVLAATGVAHAQHKTTDGGLAIIEKKQVPQRSVPVKPAGSQSLRYFTQHCTGCQLCVSACPEHVLKPSMDLKTLMQPEMQFDEGYCLTGCTRCADVCPTEAIVPITKQEKTSIQIGHAVWIRENCVVESDGVSCGNCARHCPTGAILMVENEKGALIPSVDTEKCIGCGHCEYVCPSRPFSAIYVEGHQMHRRI